MRYSFKNMAVEAGESPDLFAEAEDEFNYVINPKLKLPQDALMYLVCDCASRHRLTEPLAVLFENTTDEPIVPPFPFSVNEYFEKIKKVMYRKALRLNLSSHDDLGKEIARTTELESALGFIQARGDIKLRDCITDDERALLPIEPVPLHLTSERVAELAHSIPGLLATSKPDEALGRNLWTPRGYSVQWHITDGDWKDHKFDQRISQLNGLPPADSPAFLPWKYLTKVRGFLFAPTELWAEDRSILENLGLYPLNHLPQYEGCDWSEYLALRNQWIERGVSGIEFQKIEEQFMAHLGTDFLQKNEIAMQWPSFLLTIFLKAEQPLLYDELEREARRLLKRISDQFAGRKTPDSHILHQATQQLKCTLESDLLMFIVFYSLIFDFQRLPEIRGSISAESIRQRNSHRRRRGRPTKRVAKNTILPIRGMLVSMLRKFNITHPCDRAAEMLNALALEEVYSSEPIGARRISPSLSGVDTRAPGRTGYLTKGGKLLCDELRKIER